MNSRSDTLSASVQDVDNSDKTTLVARPEPGPSGAYNDVEKVADKSQADTAVYMLEQGHAELHERDGEKKLVLSKLEESEDPTQFTTVRKWLIFLIICSASLCTTCTSSIASSAEGGEQSTFHVSQEVSILGISLYVEGLGIGPLLLGPLSEFYGRSPIYSISYVIFFALSFPVAFAPNIAVFLVFRFLSGFVGSAFLSVAGGSVSDLFVNAHVATPMAVYTLSPFLGPILGPLIAGFINQNVSWRWTYYFQLIWAFIEVILLIFFVPETYAPALLQRKARRLRKQGVQIYTESELRPRMGLIHAVAVSCYKPFQLLFFDRMALLLDIWTALVLGILYLAFQAFPIIFGEEHGFNTQMVGCSFLGIGLGLCIGASSQIYYNRVYRRYSEIHNGNPPPEIRLLCGMPGGILVAFGLYLIAFLTFPNTPNSAIPRPSSIPWILPIIFGSIPFGIGIILIFQAVFTYLVTAYRPIAASAMAANSALRSSFAAVFPLFARQMYARLGVVGATALLAGLCTIMAPLPFVLYKYGAKIREKSKFAVA